MIVAIRQLGLAAPSRQPVQKQRFVDPADRVVVDTVERIDEVSLRIKFVHLGTLDKRHCPCERFTTRVGAGEVLKAKIPAYPSRVTSPCHRAVPERRKRPRWSASPQRRVGQLRKAGNAFAHVGDAAGQIDPYAGFPVRSPCLHAADEPMQSERLDFPFKAQGPPLRQA